MTTAEVLTQHIPYTPAEVNWARWRPPQHRTPIPAVGDRVLYRATEWAPPTWATVVEVGDQTPPPNPTEWASPFAPPFDPNVWRVKTDIRAATPVRDAFGAMTLERHPDAWPTLVLQVDGVRSHVATREARLRGSAGWLPPDWQDRARPVPGRVLPGRTEAA